jgi:Protein of unknown function (DUF5656)
MIFHFVVFLWSVIFYLALQIILRFGEGVTWGWYIWSMTLLSVVTFLAMKRLTGRLKDFFLPFLLAVTTPTLLSFIDSKTEQQIFVVLASLMVYSAFIGAYRLKQAPKDQTAVALMHTAALSGLFLFYASIYGFYLNFNFPLWALMVLFFGGTSLVSYVTLLGGGSNSEKKSHIKLYSILLGLTLSELAWVISFWPFGYLTTASISLIFYYITWDIIWHALDGSLRLKDTLTRMAFFLSLVGILLYSTPWRIVV